MSVKWQRIQYMPLVPMGKDGRRITAGEDHLALARHAAAEGMVLLKNEGHLLPFQSGTRLAVFGKAQADYVKGGGGSGDVTTAYSRSLLEGLRIKEQEGKVSLVPALSAYYEEYTKSQYALEKEPGRLQEPPVPKELLSAARAETDIAVITLCRFSGEGWDRSGSPYDGDFYLSHEEDAMVREVTAAFPYVVVVLNTGGMMDTGWFRNAQGIQAALLAWQGGIEGGLAAADLLCGDAVPSGHLSDTFAVDFGAYPSSDTFNESKDYVTYHEDIFVGYRYFETIPGAADLVCYPFGYGLSYTTFDMTGVKCAVQDQTLSLTVRVTNTGSVPGKQVVQLYAAPPEGRLTKPGRVLIGFKKTGLLQSGQSEDVEIRVPVSRMASYDDTGAVCLSAWVLEKGAYAFYLGDNVRSAAQVPFIWHLEDDLILEQLAPRCRPRQVDWRLMADGTQARVENAEPLPFPKMDESRFQHGEPVQCLQAYHAA